MELLLHVQILVQATVLVFLSKVVFANNDFYSVSLGSNVTLHCLSTKLPRLLDWSTLTVEWNRVDRLSKQIVYTFEDGRVHVSGQGAEVDSEGLLQGDASLKLYDVTVGDEGQYTCRIITPVVDTVTATLEVLAQPSVWLPEKVDIAEGEEKIIQCDVRGYYPSKLTVSWLLQNSSHTLPVRVSHLYRVCTEMAVHNADGTYNIRSGITVHSSALKDGQIRLVCQVEHRTYLYNTSITLTKALPEHNVLTLMAGTSVTSFLLVLAAVGAASYLLRYHRRKAMWHVPPNISEISQPRITYAHVENVLRCIISGVQQGEFQVCWSKLMGDSANSVIQSEVVSLLHWENVSEQATLESDGSHHTSTLSICLSTSQDGSRYRCVVHWRGQKLTREATVHVKVEPSYLQISSIPQIPKVQRLLVLCCRVENFYPSDIYLEWSRNDGESVDPATGYGPFSDHSHLYNMWSKIQLTMATEDESTVYTCRVYHSSFTAPGYRDALYHINTQGTPPNVMFINCEPLCPVLNTECTLDLCIRDFCPKDVTVTWTKDGEPVDSSCVFNTPPSLNINGLYSMYSFLKLSPTQAEWNCCYLCRVEHSAQSQPEERCFTLKHTLDRLPLCS